LRNRPAFAGRSEEFGEAGICDAGESVLSLTGTILLRGCADGGGSGFVSMPRRLGSRYTIRYLRRAQSRLNHPEGNSCLLPARLSCELLPLSKTIVTYSTLSVRGR